MTDSKSEHILIHEYLSVTAVTCTDTDSRDSGLLSDDISELCRDTLENYHTSAGFLNFKSVSDESAGCFETLALHLETAESINGLRCETEVGNYRDRSLNDSLDHVADICAALELYSVCAALLDEASGIYYSLFNTHLIGHKRHICHNECIHSSSRNCCRMVYHILHCDRKSVLIAEHNHSERVTDEDRIDSAFIHNFCCCVIVSGKHRDFVA